MKILVVQTAFLGDIILSAPVIELLSRHNPGDEIWLLTTPAGAEIFKHDPRLKGVITYDKHGDERGLLQFFRKVFQLRQHHFDKVYALHRSARTAIMLWLAGIKQRVGFDDSKLSCLYTDRKYRDGAHEIQRKLTIIDQYCAPGAIDLLKLHLGNPEFYSAEIKSWVDNNRYSLIAPGSVWATKRWYATGFKQIAHHLTEKKFQIGIVGAADEIELCAEVANNKFTNFAARTSISELLYLVSKARLVVCNDSMILHLASAFNIPVVTIFCATSPTFGFAPWNSNGRVVERKELECKPCRPHGGDSCPTGTLLCMQDLSATEVIASINEVIND